MICFECRMFGKYALVCRLHYSDFAGQDTGSGLVTTIKQAKRIWKKCYVELV